MDLGPRTPDESAPEPVPHHDVPDDVVPAAGVPTDARPLRGLFEGRTPLPIPGEGLRDRKKRELRQRISDTATGMFLDRGFDAVRVSEIAEACDVSEKTVFNYFPTKESLLFDREDDQARLITRALSGAGGRPIVDAIVDVLVEDVNFTYGLWREAGNSDESLAVIRRFAQLIEDTPALLAALHGMTERLSEVAAKALAERAGVDPDDPEPQQAAMSVVGLWRVQHRAMVRYSDGVSTAEEIRDAVLDDIRRAAAVAASGLSSFDLVVPRATGEPSSTKDQLREAAEAADEARRQMMAAVKQARTAWRQVMDEIQAHHDQHHANDDPRHGGPWGDRGPGSRGPGDRGGPGSRGPADRGPGDRASRRQLQNELRAQQHELRDEIRRYQREIRIRQREIAEQAAAARRQKRGS